jgi:outer membrane protein OmpA-like peptidoglycan-associated protein
MVRAFRRGAVGLALLISASLSSVAHAQNAPGNTFNLQLFRPAVDSKGYITVNASQILGHLDFSIGLVTTYAHNVLNLEGGNGSSFAVRDFITPQVQAAVGFFKWVELGVSLPVHIMFGGRSPGFNYPANPNLNSDLTFSGQFIGDLGIHPKVRFLNTSKYPVGLALITSIYAPTGDSKKFLGEGQVSFRPEVIVDKEFGRTRRFKAALNFGALIRPSKNVFPDYGDVLDLKAPMLNAGAPFCAPSNDPTQPTPPVGSNACGTGRSRAVGTQITYSLGMSFAVVPQKFDILGELYGYADATGEKTANPLEGLLAAKVYLARNSFFEIGGGAGLLPKSVTSEGGMTGSPEFRLFLGFIFEPSIGDRDGDGIKDDVDKCPDDPEDFDDFEDEDGCPDPDNDKDRILDKDDKCPNEPETYNGYQDEDGCPDKGRVILRKGALEILDKIYFETAKAIIKPISFPILNAVAATLKGNPQILLLEVQGHADERGDDDYNMRLTEDRSAAVKTYLIEHGVEAERLQSHGYGETKPVCPQHNEACWSKNRRVEFVILRKSGETPGTQ